MAKSIRSSWKKKMRAIKRVRNSARELETLKKVLATDPTHPINKNKDVDMSNIEDIVTVTDGKKVVEEHRQQEDNDAMDTSEKSKYNKRTMKDENGKYPPWFSKKKIKSLQLKNKRMKMAQKQGKKLKRRGKRRHN